MSKEDYLRKIDYWRDMYKKCAVALNVSRKAHKETQTVYQTENKRLMDFLRTIKECTDNIDEGYGCTLETTCDDCKHFKLLPKVVEFLGGRWQSEQALKGGEK